MTSRRYVDDVDYVRTFIPQLAPAWIDFVGLLWGLAPPDRSAGYAWCDLGCGQGVTAVILAATHPQGDFHGVDIRPSHVANARRLADAAGVHNATFHAADFGAAAERPFPAFDYITAHGVYSWVDEQARADLRRFVDRNLKPGGRLYLSYNALPGRNADAPFQRMMYEFGRRAPGDSEAQVVAAQAFVSRLKRQGTPSILASPLAGVLLRPEAHRGVSYLAHELMNPQWRSLSVLEARADMAAIGLSPAGSATIVDNFDAYVLGRASRKILAGIDDPALHALVRDYLVDQKFRSDVYVRGGATLSAVEQRRRLLATPFALSRPKSRVRWRFQTSAGELSFDNPVARLIVAALASGPKPLAALAASQGAHDELIASAMALAASGQIIPVELGGGAGAARFNQVVMQRLAGPEQLDMLALDCGTAVVLGGKRLEAMRAGASEAAWRTYLSAHGAGVEG